jgi:hypothetical protein
MSNGIGGGLIGAGAFLLLTTLWWLAPSPERVGLAEHRRAKRNRDAATIVSAASTFAGAVLLLVGSEWLWALLGVLASALLYYVVLVTFTRTEWTMIRQQVVRERQHGDGRITVATDGLINMRQYTGTSLASHFMGDADYGAQAELVAERNSRWRWALRHPRGGDWQRTNL